jgi:hypothetical protein
VGVVIARQRADEEVLDAATEGEARLTAARWLKFSFALNGELSAFFAVDDPSVADVLDAHK